MIIFARPMNLITAFMVLAPYTVLSEVAGLLCPANYRSGRQQAVSLRLVSGWYIIADGPVMCYRL